MQDDLGAIAHVVGAVVVDGDRVLLGLRSPLKLACPDMWDVPGGHVETGESGAYALRRELTEELGIGAEVTADEPDVTLDSEEFRLELWLVRRWSGSIRNAAPEEHVELRWFRADELAGVRLADDRYLGLLTRLLSS